MTKIRQYPLLLVHIFIIGGMLFALQMNPFPRIWTFFAPLFILQSAVGLVWLYQKLPSALYKFGGYIFIVAFIFATSFYIIKIFPIVSQRSYEDAYLEIRNDLATSDSTQVISYYPLTDFLRYYFVRDDLDLSQLSVNMNNANISEDTIYLMSLANQTPAYIINSRNDIELVNITWTEIYQTEEVVVYILDSTSSDE